MKVTFRREKKLPLIRCVRDAKKLPDSICPYLTESPSLLGVPSFPTGSTGLTRGYAQIKIDKEGKPSFTYRLIPVDKRLDNRVDATFSSIIEDYAAEVKEKMEVKLGYAPYYINRGTPESALGNLTADGLIWMAKLFHNKTADVAVYNSGGVRANISKGDVTLGDVYAVYPFDNVL